MEKKKRKESNNKKRTSTYTRLITGDKT